MNNVHDLPNANKLPANYSSSNTTIEAQRAISETQAAMVIAKQFPRNEKEALEKIKEACRRQKVAESAIYAYPKGKGEKATIVEGASIRLAEVIAQNWGNIKFGWTELSRDNDESEIKVFAWDIENNIDSSRTVRIKHVRYAYGKNTPLKSPRDIYEIVAADASKRLRACLLAIVPADIVEEAMIECVKTLKATANISPENIKKLVEEFSKYDVTKQMIIDKIGRNLDSMQPAQVVHLRKIYASLKDGMSAAADWFAVDEPQSAKEAAKDILTPKSTTKEPSAAEQEELTLVKEQPEITIVFSDDTTKQYPSEITTQQIIDLTQAYQGSEQDEGLLSLFIKDNKENMPTIIDQIRKVKPNWAENLQSAMAN